MVKLNNFGISKRCNVSEYSFVANGIVSRIQAYGVEKLHIPEGVFEKFQTNVGKLQEQMHTGRGTNETYKIDNIDNEMNQLLSFVLGVIRLAKNSAIKNKYEAAMALDPVIKPYQETRRAPRRQKQAKVLSMLLDLSAEERAAYITTLKLDEEVEMLTLKNAQYLVLLDKRADQQVQNSHEKTTSLRTEMDDLLTIILTSIRYLNYNEPSDELTSLVVSLNKLFSDAETEFNQRTAERDDEDTVDEGEGSEGEVSEGDSEKPAEDEQPTEGTDTETNEPTA